MIEVLRTGPLTTVQDLGRPRWAHLGVGRSGAADRPSLRLANRLVGNPENAAALETTFGGLSIRLLDAATIAVTGAPVPVTVDGRIRDTNAPLDLAAGSVVELGLPTAGVRSYLAVRGGVAVPDVLGSRSTDLLAQLGPDRLSAGDGIPIGAPTGDRPGVDHAPVRPLPADPVLHVLPGPRADWFTPEAMATLGSATYEVSSQSDRVGARLTGPALERSRSGELLSEGLVEGAVQVPADGQPVVFLADHPVTGGYPVIAVVHPADVPLAAQARPGQRVRFRVDR
ncbi:biotin-dependent carboxyltransferase family protein [Arsenicicoccus piscis]|uniref:Allophanate hydrolase n=1 Tax=Arsenicicoccus piscis TaxID=673954 RepID=A0ABQ6HVK1_9MICO|nr:biotin-dependent carboxyltransferase family protein [Arsenicicoccus piscis]MCH8628384.1 biotin-dependent carboxyltransferase family protein [Arsenicicoccus piscis]GMA22007.1 allophanate hydrolase [Arsenicicoccus piscis]